MKAEAFPLTNQRGVDVVIEHVGESTWAQSLALMRVARFFGKIVLEVE